MACFVLRLVYFCSVLWAVGAQQYCALTWNRQFANKDGNYEPVLTHSTQLAQLSANSQLLLEYGASLTAFCEAGHVSNPQQQSVVVTCEQGHFVPALAQLACTAPASFDIAPAEPLLVRQLCAETSALAVRVNSALGWADVYYVCFDTTSKSAVKSFSLQRAAAYSMQYDVPRPYDRWSDAQYEHFLVPKAYTRRQQILAFSAVLDNYYEYLADNSLQRGHLNTFAAAAFFVQRNASCEYINNSPQWMTVNMGNLHAVETVLAALAFSTNTEMQIFTHSTGRLALPDSSGQLVPLSLFMDADQHLVDVPAYIFKRFSHPGESRTYVAYVLNNPFLTSVPAEPEDCNDVTATTEWWPSEVFRTNTVADIRDGYTWLCSPSNADLFIAKHTQSL